MKFKLSNIKLRNSNLIGLNKKQKKVQYLIYDSKIIK